MWRLFALVALIACGSKSRNAPATPARAAGDMHDGTVAAAAAAPSPELRAGGVARAGSAANCENLTVADLSIDGLLDDWHSPQVLARAGVASDGAVEVRCAWDGTALALALDIKDDRVVRVRGKGHEDRVDVAVSAGAHAVAVSVLPGNAIARPKITAPAKVTVADSLQPKGFSVELEIPAAAIPDFSPSTPGLDVKITFHDADQATGGDDSDIPITTRIELSDRKDLLDDFLATVRLKRTDIKLDTLVDLDPDRKGKERLVAGGTVIGVLTDQFAYVTLPAQAPADIKKIELLALGARGTQIVSAVVHQGGNGGARDLLMLWTVWSGQLQPLGQIEIRKELGTNVLESTYKLAKGKKGPELVVEPRPAVGFTADAWNEAPADDADSILLPWDTKRGGIAYSLKGAELERRDLPAPKKPRR